MGLRVGIPRAYYNQKKKKKKEHLPRRVGARFGGFLGDFRSELFPFQNFLHTVIIPI